MGNKMGHARKLELPADDGPALEQHDAPGSSESPVPVQSSDGGKDDKDEISLTGTYVSYSELTGKLDLRDTAAQARREAEAQEDKEQNPFADTTGIKVYPFVKTRIGWTQRVFNWFKRD